MTVRHLSDQNVEMPPQSIMNVNLLKACHTCQSTEQSLQISAIPYVLLTVPDGRDMFGEDGLSNHDSVSLIASIF